MLSGLISAWRILAFFSNFKARNSCWLYDLTAFTCNPTSFPYFFRTCREKQSDVSGYRGGESRDRRLLRCGALYSLVEVDLAGCVQYYTFVTLHVIIYLKQYRCGTKCCTFTLFLIYVIKQQNAISWPWPAPAWAQSCVGTKALMVGTTVYERGPRWYSG